MAIDEVFSPHIFIFLIYKENSNPIRGKGGAVVHK